MRWWRMSDQIIIIDGVEYIYMWDTFIPLKGAGRSSVSCAGEDGAPRSDEHIASDQLVDNNSSTQD
jgi:hypothetical protein